MQDNTQFSSDYFFYHGKNSLQEECRFDLVSELLQSKRSMFYARSFGAGVTEYENYPNGLTLQIGLRYDIAQAIALRNQRVTSGEDNYPDRRIALSQFSIEFIREGGDNLSLTVIYFLYADYSDSRSISLPVGRSS